MLDYNSLWALGLFYNRIAVLYPYNLPAIIFYNCMLVEYPSIVSVGKTTQVSCDATTCAIHSTKSDAAISKAYLPCLILQ